MIPRLRSLTFRQLEMFTTIAREGSFRRAADALMVSEPAISQQIKALERTVGTLLFDRAHGTPPRLTDAGRRLLKAAENAAAQFEESFGELDALERADAGCVAFGAGRAFSIHLLPMLYASFERARPGVTVRSEASRTSSLVEGLLQKRLDLALVLGQIAEARLSSTPFGRVDQVLIGPPGHYLAGERPAPFEALAAERLIRPAAGTSVMVALEREAADHRMALSVSWEVDGVEAQVNAVASGLGLGVVPYYAAVSHLNTGAVALLNISGFPMRFNWYLVEPVSEASPAVRTFRTHLLRQQAELEARALVPALSQWVG